jgi:hypothetical protein
LGAPQIPASDIADRIAVLSRSPFRDQVVRILSCAPSDGAIVELAEKHPDRWGQLLALVARLGGYNEKLELEGTLTQKISGLSDAELLAAIRQSESSFDILSNDTSTKSLESHELTE